MLKFPLKMRFGTLLLCFFCQACFAIPCPFSSFSENVKLGSTPDVVKAVCGPPAQIETETGPDSQDQKIQTMTYMVTQSVQNAFIQVTSALATGNLLGKQVFLTLTISPSHTVSAISLNGQSVQQARCGNNSLIHVGDSINAVKMQCGTAYMLNEQKDTVVVAPKKIIRFIYTRAGLPSETLSFVNNELQAT